jgi:hypothetical protein
MAGGQVNSNPPINPNPALGQLLESTKPPKPSKPLQPDYYRGGPDVIIDTESLYSPHALLSWLGGLAVGLLLGVALGFVLGHGA